MGTTLSLRAKDGHALDAYMAEASGTPKGGLVVVQEIFGVTKHIERVVDRYAAEGYKAIAPAMFDRVERGVQLPYSAIDQGREYMRRLEWPHTLADIEAAANAVRDAGPTAIVGYCWGGTVAHVAACELDFAAAVSYYGGAVAKMLDKKPRCPIMYHFGDQDAAIPLIDVEKIKSAIPESTVFVYAGAGHGFNCDERKSFSPKDSETAFGRSVAFLQAHASSHARSGPRSSST